MLGVQKEVMAELQAVPSDLWSLASVGIGAFMLVRTVEKVAPAIATRK